jgi:hypothetical protein
MVLYPRDDPRRSIQIDGDSIMKRQLFLTLAVAGLFAWAGQLLTIAAHSHPHEKNAFTSDTIPWGPAPPVVPAGAQFAALEGDPTASSGEFKFA